MLLALPVFLTWLVLIMIMGTCSKSWWRHQMETFSALLPISSGNSPVPGEFPAQRPVTRSFDVFFDLHPNKRLSKQLWGWFETSSRLLWRHCNIVLGFLLPGCSMYCIILVYRTWVFYWNVQYWVVGHCAAYFSNSSPETPLTYMV